MRRRSLIVTLGSIAAGAATVAGTGAVSTMRAERNVTGRVVGDRSAYVSIEPGEDHDFAVDNLDGEFRVAFDNDPTGGAGLNPDSINSFDDVFRVRNTGEEELNVYIEDSQPDLGFYFGEGSNDPTQGEPGQAGSTETIRVGPARQAVVGVWVDLRDQGPGSVFNGDSEDFTIYAEDGSGDEQDTRD
jgi:hypothetical protein